MSSQLREHQAHRAGSVNQVMIRQPDTDLIEAMHRARQRFDQGSPWPGQVRGKGERDVGRHADELGGSSVEGDTKRAVVFTEVGTAHPAEATGAVRQIGVDGDEVTDLDIGHAPSDGNHLATEFVAGDDRVPCRRDVALEQMKIRPADAACLNLQDRIGRPRYWIVNPGHLDLAGLFKNDSLHFTAPMVRPRISCFCAIHPASRTGRLASVAAAASFA